MSGEDKSFIWNLLMALLDTNWARRLKEDPTLKDKTLQEIFDRMNQILLEKFPLIVRHMDYKRLKRGNGEFPSTLIKRVFSSSQQAQLDNAPLVSRVLVKIITLLGSTCWKR